ncbi:MAG: fluoride efflux transporter CrcB [Gammaproteobacteria bacterium]|jgi:CrcB protein|nr:fluoride efflux transporter CrcB [Gammaproteobacteria bacterium]
MKISLLAAVAAGGAAGSVLRYLLGIGAHSMLGRGFPWGTLLVNAIGAFAVGLLYALLIERNAAAPLWRALFLTGLLGGFTTFSAFSLETLLLHDQGETFRAALNIFLNVALCLAFAWLGLNLMRQI